MKQTASYKCFGGEVRTYTHAAETTRCAMTFSVYLPPAASEAGRARPPVIYYLSGLTCTDQNALTKAGLQAHAAARNVALVFPDTSPRGYSPAIENDSTSWDFGLGASFYVRATTERWRDHYNMYDYVVSELPALLERELPDALDHKRRSIMGHSMGGHGALVCALKNPGRYVSVSAFAPVCNPVNCPWGVKAFTGYLGADTSAWRAWDACELVRAYAGPPVSVLVDQGTADSFLAQKQLLPDALVEAAKHSKLVSLHLRFQGGYDHSYYFMLTFGRDHVDFHADALERAARL